MVTEHSKTKWPHTGSEALTVSPLPRLKTSWAKWKLPFLLCSSNMLQRKALSTNSPDAGAGTFLASCAGPCFQRAAKQTMVWGVADGDVVLWRVRNTRAKWKPSDPGEKNDPNCPVRSSGWYATVPHSLNPASPEVLLKVVTNDAWAFSYFTSHCSWSCYLASHSLSRGFRLFSCCYGITP